MSPFSILLLFAFLLVLLLVFTYKYILEDQSINRVYVWTEEDFSVRLAVGDTLYIYMGDTDTWIQLPCDTHRVSLLGKPYVLVSDAAHKSPSELWSHIQFFYEQMTTQAWYYQVLWFFHLSYVAQWFLRRSIDKHTLTICIPVLNLLLSQPSTFWSSVMSITLQASVEPSQWSDWLEERNIYF